MAAVKRIKKVHHITINPSPNSNVIGTSKPIPARKRLRPSIGYSYVISSPISELKTRYAPAGNDNIIKQKITVIKAVCGIASACKILFCDDTFFQCNSIVSAANPSFTNVSLIVSLWSPCKNTYPSFAVPPHAYLFFSSLATFPRLLILGSRP